MSGTSSPSADNLLLGAGELFFDRFDDSGLSTGFLHLGNVDTFEITTADELAEKFESMTASKNLYKRVSKRRNVTMRVTGNEFNPDNLALALGGTRVEYTQTATPVVDETLTTSTKKGCFYKFAKIGPHTAITLKKSPSTSLVLNTDYVIKDANIGIVQLISSATCTDGSTLLASYTPTAYSSGSGLATVRGGVSSRIGGRVLFRPDPATGPKLMVEVWKVAVSPEGALGFISEDYATLALTMAVESDAVNHATEPLYKVTYL